MAGACSHLLRLVAHTTVILAVAVISDLNMLLATLQEVLSYAQTYLMFQALAG